MPRRMLQGSIAGDYNNVCYSQLGEDQVIEHFFTSVKPTDHGTYLDVGCHHPIKFSNTYMLYERGWRGVCVDADASLATLYKTLRPNDRFVASGVGSECGELTFYEFENAAANTFDKETRDTFLAKGWRLRKESVVKVERLEKICESAGLRSIDYLNIDVEGLDLDALMSFDFGKCRPQLLSVETNCRDLGAIDQMPIAKYLGSSSF